MKELLNSLTKLFPTTNEYTILCSKELYPVMLKQLNIELTGNPEPRILIKSFETDFKTFNIREGLSIEKGFKVEF
tara:strand:+ start:93 stop:317 length:225 start_codon:yes stop_codon:yes gene_type:complete